MDLAARFIRQPATLGAQWAALLTLGLIALPVLMQLPLAIGVMFGMLFVVRAILVQRGWAGVKGLWLLPVVAGAMALVYTQLGTLFGREGGMAFLLLMALMKSYEGRTTRDWQVLLGASLFLVVGILLFDQSLWLGVWVAAAFYAVWVGLAMLGRLNLKQSLRQAALGLLLSLPLMMVMFVAVPRLSHPLWRIPQPQKTTAKSGLSDTLKPGSISELIQENTLVFNASFMNATPKPEDLYWRVMVMERYDGVQWRAADKNLVTEAPAAQGEKISYEIIGKDEDGYLPALDYPVADTADTRFGLGATIMARRSYDQLRRLRLQSVRSGSLPEILDERERAQNLYLPQKDPRTHALAQQLRSGNTDIQTVQAALNWLKAGGFRYTLTPPLLKEANTVDEFLFESKQGFCEHYASSFAVLMRAAGVPARIVTGYQGGQFHAGSGFWQVHSKEAHAWVEVWLEADHAWRRIDPTAAIAAQRSSAGVEEALGAEAAQIQKAPAWLAEFSAKSQYYWQQWIVDFDADKQNELFRKLGFERVSVGSVLLILLGGGALALTPLAWWWIKKQRPSDPLAAGFLLLKERLALSGSLDAAHIESLGPMEVLALAPNAHSAKLIEQYIDLRYRHSSAAVTRAHWRWYHKARHARL